MIENITNIAHKKSTSISKPYVWLFNSEGKGYVLDHHTNRLFALSKREAEYIRLWLEGRTRESLALEYATEAAEIQKLQDDGLFCCRPPDGLAFGAGWDEIEVMIRRKRAHTILEITQQCNLRCKYCTFGGGFKDHRRHSSKSMSIETLEEAVLSAIEHGVDNDSISMGFYGGEPLLRFDLIKHAVAFAHRHSAGKPLKFSMTTNATLVEKESAEFLRDNDFSVLVSIDGPKHMHNRYRVHADGQGSYEKTIEGLRLLLETFPQDMHERIGLNPVIPAIGWVKQLHELWDQEPWLPRGIRVQVSVLDPPEGFVALPVPEGTTWGDIREEWFEITKSGQTDSSPIRSDLFERQYALIHQRSTFPGHRTHFFPNGCCIPAVRKIYVTVDGEYLICERAHGCPPIGHLRTGVDIDRIKQLVNEYVLNSVEDCRSCMAIANCNLCFNQAYEGGIFSSVRKQSYCDGERRAFAEGLSGYCQLRKKNPEQIKKWEAIKFA